MTLEADTIVRRSPRAVYRKLSDGEGGVLLHLDSAAYHGVNETGALVWEHIEDAPTFTSLIASLDGELDAQPEHWSDEIAAFLDELRERDLVEFDS